MRRPAHLRRNRLTLPPSNWTSAFRTPLLPKTELCRISPNRPSAVLLTVTKTHFGAMGGAGSGKALKRFAKPVWAFRNICYKGFLGSEPLTARPRP